jgi:hypothetical protein
LAALAAGAGFPTRRVEQIKARLPNGLCPPFLRHFFGKIKQVPVDGKRFPGRGHLGVNGEAGEHRGRVIRPGFGGKTFVAGKLRRRG